MEAWFIVFGVLLAIAGYQDYKTRKVADKLSAGMWCCAAFYLSSYNVLVWVFALIYMFNALVYPINPKFGFGWADVLIFPVYSAFLFSISHQALLTGLLLSSGLSVAYLLLYKKGSAYVEWLAVSYWLVLICF